MGLSFYRMPKLLDKDGGNSEEQPSAHRHGKADLEWDGIISEWPVILPQRKAGSFPEADFWGVMLTHASLSGLPVIHPVRRCLPKNLPNFRKQAIRIYIGTGSKCQAATPNQLKLRTDRRPVFQESLAPDAVLGYRYRSSEPSRKSGFEMPTGGCF